ncbi:hypothetical protein [Streptococcus mitis]|uniref:hypothetical protein n=1 Tax=Streptococcus mitis TaxID=28037 RepID=UPI00115B6575|nr:hypothetical protein [Streptococcus mitis]
MKLTNQFSEQIKNRKPEPAVSVIYFEILNKKEHLSPSFEITDTWLVGVPSISDTFFQGEAGTFLPSNIFR